MNHVKTSISRPYGICAIEGPAEDVAFILRHLPDIDDKAPENRFFGIEVIRNGIHGCMASVESELERFDFSPTSPLAEAVLTHLVALRDDLAARAERTGVYAAGAASPGAAQPKIPLTRPEINNTMLRHMADLRTALSRGTDTRAISEKTWSRIWAVMSALRDELADRV